MSERNGSLDAQVADDLGIPDVVDFRITQKPLLHDFRGAKGVAAVDQGDFAGEAGQEGRLLDGRVSAADDADVLVAIEAPSQVAQVPRP